jgi:hypothetical protein
MEGKGRAGGTSTRPDHGHYVRMNLPSFTRPVPSPVLLGLVPYLSYVHCREFFALSARELESLLTPVSSYVSDSSKTCNGILSTEAEANNQFDILLSDSPIDCGKLHRTRVYDLLHCHVQITLQLTQRQIDSIGAC